jgi:hypothetical protein
LFGRIGLRTFGGGPRGVSFATTGLGSSMVEAGREIAGTADDLHRNGRRLEFRHGEVTERGVGAVIF